MKIYTDQFEWVFGFAITSNGAALGLGPITINVEW